VKLYEYEIVLDIAEMIMGAGVNVTWQSIECSTVQWILGISWWYGKANDIDGEQNFKFANQTGHNIFLKSDWHRHLQISD